MALNRRIAAKMTALMRANPRLQRGEALRRYATLCVQEALLLESLEGGKADDRRLRALTETQRMLLDAGRGLGIIPAPVRAVPPEEPEREEEPKRKLTNQERRRRAIFGDDDEDDEEEASRSRRGIDQMEDDE